MQELESNADSVNYLITQLCHKLTRQHELQQPAAVHKLKLQSFEILLKKSTRPHYYANPKEEMDFDPQRALDVHIFAAKLNANGSPQVCAKFAGFEQQLAVIKEEPYFETDTGRAVLQLLLLLQGNVREEEQIPVTRPQTLLVPGPFTLFANYEHNRYYPIQDTSSWLQPTPRFFKGVESIATNNNPYMPKFLLQGEQCNKLAAIEQRFAPEQQRPAASAQDCTFTGMTRRLLGATMRVNLSAFGLFKDCPAASVEQQQTKLNLQCSNTKLPVVPAPEPAPANTTPRIFAWNWESLGCFGIPCEKPFTSEANVALDLQSYHCQMQGHAFEAKILTLKQFMQDLKSLTAGIQSDTFQHDEYIVFTMEPNITVEGLLPATISNYVVDFLECGTCYKRLQTMIMKRDYKLMFEGFMFRALCSAVDEYLLTFRQFVFAQHDEHLLGYHKRMKKMMKQITNLSFTLAIHPNVDASIAPPMGSQFLGYLYREIVRLTEKDYIMLLVFILKRCCHVYFKHLQKWMYYGLLDDPCNELFICFVDHYRPNTKYFYDKAYFVRKEAVPGFFQNYEDQILQCGKYTMLLKAYKPNHPLFDLEYPAISVCLTFEEIQKLKISCAKYKERAHEVCGKNNITIRKMFEARAAQKRHFLQIAGQRTRENLERWSDEQQATALIAAEQKKKRWEELTTQLQDAKQRKVAERRANVELELRLLREAERMEEQRLLRENINLRKRIEYYQELSDMMQSDAKEENTKQQQQKLALQLASMSGAESTQAPQTPASGGTDFESCGEEDAHSLYAECLSEEFVQKFAENEQELRAMCQEKENNNVGESETAKKQQQQLLTEVKLKDAKEQEDTSSGSLYSAEGVSAAEMAIQVKMSEATFLKRSVSDVFNSNELPAATIVSKDNANAELCPSSTTFIKVATQLQVATSEQAPVALTEAQRNKLRVLSHEYGSFGEQTETSTVPDINLNTLPDSELTDLQRNRKRMMQDDLFSEFNKDPLADRTHMNLNLDTDRARNRRKVLESEFHILSGQSTSTTTFTVDALTPMSTTSDTPLTESVSESTKLNNEQKNDLENGNLLAKPALKINVELANEPTQQTKAQTVLTTAVEETPECALNTAGLQAKKGFDFVDAEKLKKQQQEAAGKTLIQHESSTEEEACPKVDYTDPYKRSLELIESNFKCATRSPYIRLNVSPTAMTVAARKSSESLQQLKLNSMSVITLTEFLQKSVIIPMTTHLEIVNNEVMRLFLEDLHILDHLRSLRNYFFLMDGEFGSIICDGIIGKLESGATPAKLLNYQMLHAILDTALGSSITGNDKNAENLSFIVNDVPFKFDLSSPGVLNTLSLSYRINWPLNLILNPETLEQYGNIFKYLIKVRRISWVLERAYQILKEAVKKHGKQILKSPQYRHVQQIRHKFYHFVHALQNHITANALQASWKTFKDELLQAKSIEDIYRKHTQYIKRILFLCMLNRHSAEFYNTIENIFKISLRFYNNLKSREFKLRSGDEHYTHSRYEKLSSDEQEFDKFIKFTIYLGNKIVRHGYQAEIGEFISLINFNQYYTESTK